jgi:hypothetical protein
MNSRERAEKIVSAHAPEMWVQPDCLVMRALADHITTSIDAETAELRERVRLLRAECEAYRAAREGGALLMWVDSRGLVSDPVVFRLMAAIDNARAATDAAKALEAP